jgi:hypothetical protein
MKNSMLQKLAILSLLTFLATGCVFGENKQFFESTGPVGSEAVTADGTPAPTPDPSIVAPTATPDASLAGLTPTPTPADAIPSATATPAATATPVPAATATPAPTATPTPAPTATPAPAATATPVPTATPVAAATPNSNICIEFPDSAACNETPVATAPGVVTILFTMSQIPQDSGTLILANAIKYASPAAQPKILFVKDSNTGGEDEGDPAYIKNTLLQGYNVTYGVIAAGGLNLSDTNGFDLVIVSNPGYPLSNAKTLTTLKAFAGGVILVGDDMSHGSGFDISSLTGLSYYNNGTAMSCNGHTYNYDNESGYKYQVSINEEFLPGISSDLQNYQYGNDLDWTTANAGTEVLAWGSAAPGTCDIGLVPAIARHLK